MRHEIDDDEIIKYIRSYLKPDDVFSERDLSMWAESNGYIKTLCDKK